MKYTLKDLRQAFFDLYGIDITSKVEKSPTELTNMLIVYGYIARQIYENEMRLPMKTIGAFVGKDHATASFYIRRFNELNGFDKTIQDIYTKIKDYLKVDEIQKPDNIECYFGKYQVFIEVNDQKQFVGIISITEVARKKIEEVAIWKV